nr:alcohol acyl transferase 1 allele RGb-like [Ziziphus jujuba var. spinosa]
MESSPCLPFQVKQSEPQLIVPSKPTPNELKNLSDIDAHGLVRCQIPFIWYYKNNPKPSMENRDPVKLIKDALGKALVHFYPLAGRLMEVSNRKLVVDCNAKGVLFIEADADISLRNSETEFNLHTHFFIKFCIMYQDLIVTRLKCGSFIFALRFNHTMLDTFGIFLFMKTLGEMIKGEKEPSISMVWQTELLSARNPPRITCTHHEYQQAADQPTNLDQTNLVQCSFFFSPNNIRAIKKHLPKHLHYSCSRYELLTACLWRCQTLTLQLDPEQVVRVSMVGSLRGMKHGGGGGLLPLLLGYYANAFVLKTAISYAGVLCRNPSGYAVRVVKNAKAEMDDIVDQEEYIKLFADLLAVRGRPPYAVKGNFVVSDNRNILILFF